MGMLHVDAPAGDAIIGTPTGGHEPRRTSKPRAEFGETDRSGSVRPIHTSRRWQAERFGSQFR